MVKHYISFNGRRSDEFHLYIDSELKLVSAKPDIEEVEVPGRDGSVLVSNDRLKAISQTIPFVLKIPYNSTRSFHQIVDEIQEWLSPRTWKFLDFSWDTDHYYNAVVLEDFEIAAQTSHFGKLAVTFKIQPFKYLSDGGNPVRVTNGMVLNNPTKHASKPSVSLQGSGSVTIRLGDSSMSFRNISNGAYIQSEHGTVSVDNSSAMNKVLSNDLFELKPGPNMVYISNPSFEVTVSPMWRKKV